jgi:hypothetical protein
MEFITEFVWFLVQCAFWYFVFSILMTPMRRKLEAKNEELQGKLDNLNEIVHIVNVEQHGDYYYWFDADNDNFLAQGKTTDETVSHLKSRFPDHIFFVQSKEQSYRLSGPDWQFVPFKLNEPTTNN